MSEKDFLWYFDLVLGYLVLNDRENKRFVVITRTDTTTDNDLLAIKGEVTE